jgi:hypothetical protein
MIECPKCFNEFKGAKCSCGYVPTRTDDGGAAQSWQARKAEIISQAIEAVSADQHMVAVLSSVKQRGFHRWAYEIVALADAGIYKGSANQVAEARSMIAGWEGKSEMREAA